MTKTDILLMKMDKKDLLDILHNMARKLSEEKRDKFMEMLAKYTEAIPVKPKQHENRRKRLAELTIQEEEAIQKRKKEIEEWYQAIEEGELQITAQGYEDYEKGYWNSEWIYEYDDEAAIGRKIEESCQFAQECLDKGKYEAAISVFEMIMNTEVTVDDENTGDYFTLTLDEMVKEKLVAIDLKKLALYVLYADYQRLKSEQRAKDMYEYFGYPYFQDIHVEDIFSIGTEELQNVDEFWSSWIQLLKQKEGDVEARLLKEAVLYHRGVDGLLEIAGNSYEIHPSLYLKVIEGFLFENNMDKAISIGLEALNKLNKDLVIRGEIAIITARIAADSGDSRLKRECWYEAFYSNSIVTNYLRLFCDTDCQREYKEKSEIRIQALNKSVEDTSSAQQAEKRKNILSRRDYQLLSFLSGDFEQTINLCKQQKDLGWSGNFVEIGIPLFLLCLHEGEILGKAGREVAINVAYKIGFSAREFHFELVQRAIVGDLVTTNNKDGEIFWETFLKWKTAYEIKGKDQEKYVEYLDEVIDKRIKAIVGGQYRNKYDSVARLAAAVGEMKESRGEKLAKKQTIEKYKAAFPRHSSFQSELYKWI